MRITSSENKADKAVSFKVMNVCVYEVSENFFVALAER